MKKLIRLFLYCGVSKEEYNSVKKDAYVSNFNVWKHLHLFMLLAFAFMFLESVLHNGFGTATILRSLVVIYAATVTYFFFFVLDPDSLAAQLIIYLTMVVLLVCSFWYALRQSDMMAVSFIVMLVLLPMFMIDKPYFMAIVLFLSGLIYLLHAEMIKSGDALRGDIINVIVYGILGIIANTFYNALRVREFMLTRQTKTQLEDLTAAAEETEKLNSVLQSMSESLIDVLGDVVESRDPDSGDHIQRVKGYTYLLASRVMEELPEYGLTQHEVNLMTFASALHDVGKIAISDTILLKPGRLTDHEFEIMKTHCEKGCSIIRKMAGSWSEEYLAMGLAICGSHHEKWDGRGYPQGLRGDEIPIAAQIVSIADIYDALTTDRVYKEAYSCDKAFAMIMDGECGAFSEKLLACFRQCREAFAAHAADPTALVPGESHFEIVSSGSRSDYGFVVGLHNADRTLQEKLALSEELSVIRTLSERFFYVCYVNMETNELTRFKATDSFARILDSFGPDLPPNRRFDRLLNTVIVAEDYDNFKKVTHRETAMEALNATGHTAVSFRIRLEDGIHYCRLRISLDPNDPKAVIIGIINVDEEHERERRAVRLQQELETARREVENREALDDRLAVINCVSAEYDYVCSLNVDTMAVTVYRAEPWICDMFKNLEDIVTSPEVRDDTLRGIIHPDDFERFAEGSQHENVLKGLAENNGLYQVNYRAYKYGKLIHYQTRYVLDRANPKRIVIGLHSIDDYVRAHVND